jgi:hypothetical protein
VYYCQAAVKTNNHLFLMSKSTDKIKALAAVILGVVMLQSSLGMLVYHHHCHATGISETSIYFAEFDCTEHHSGKDAGSCCTMGTEAGNYMNTSCQASASEACCETSMEYIQWDEDLDVKSNIRLVYKAIILAVHNDNFEDKAEVSPKERNNFNDPPPLKAIERLLMNQQLRLMPPLA